MGGGKKKKGCQEGRLPKARKHQVKNKISQVAMGESGTKQQQAGMNGMGENEKKEGSTGLGTKKAESLDPSPPTILSKKKTTCFLYVHVASVCFAFYGWIYM